MRLILLVLVLLFAACTPGADAQPTSRPASISTTILSQTKPTPTAAAVKEHIVQPGESLWTIARSYGVELSAILKANPDIKDASMIQPGQKIMIPATTGR